jgi:hypothetical protein
VLILRRHADAGPVAVYFGLIVLIATWWALGRALPASESWLRRTLLLWLLPLALGPPLFSRDVYSYLAQGAMVIAGIEVYQLGALNPLVLLHFVAGAHNDAVMMGLLVAGLVAATRYRILGASLVALAGLVKAPAALGLLAVAWWWAGPARNWAKALACTASVALATGIAVTLAAGTGYGWMSALDTPVSATNWSLSSTLGRLSDEFLRTIGSDLAGLAVPTWRWIGIAAALVTALVAWLRHSPVYALGLSLAGFALFGPAIRPWYLLWGLIPIAAAAPPGTARRCCAVLCAILAIVVLPDGYPPTVAQLGLAAAGSALAGVALWRAGVRWPA